jgi:hypothetical protein
MIIRLHIESEQKFDYYFYNADQLLDKGCFNGNPIEAEFEPLHLNRLRLYMHNVSSSVRMKELELDKWMPICVCLASNAYPIPNHTELRLTKFQSNQLDRDGYFELEFTWPFEDWYYNWMQQNWHKHFLNN